MESCRQGGFWKHEAHDKTHRPIYRRGDIVSACGASCALFQVCFFGAIIRFGQPVFRVQLAACFDNIGAKPAL
jgi:hypothetical protein